MTVLQGCPDSLRDQEQYPLPPESPAPGHAHGDNVQMKTRVLHTRSSADYLPLVGSQQLALLQGGQINPGQVYLTLRFGALRFYPIHGSHSNRPLIPQKEAPFQPENHLCQA